MDSVLQVLFTAIITLVVVRALNKNTDVMSRAVALIGDMSERLSATQHQNGQTAKAINTEFPQLYEAIRCQMSEIAKRDDARGEEIEGNKAMIRAAIARLEYLEKQLAGEAIPRPELETEAIP